MNKILDFLNENLLWVIIFAALVVVIILLTIVIVSIKNRTRKRLKKQVQQVLDANSQKTATDSTNLVTADTTIPTPQAVPEENLPVETIAPTANESVAPKTVCAETVETSCDKAPQVEVAPVATAEVAPVAAAEVAPVVATATPAKKKPATKTAVAKKAKASDTNNDSPAPKKGGYSGKWTVIQKSENEFIANLYASNGAVLLVSEVYSTEKGALSGIETIKKNIQLGNFETHCDKNKNYYYKLKSSANRLLCVGAVYNTRVSCESSITSVKKFAESAVTTPELVVDMTVIQYTPSDIKYEIKEGYRGKWRINPNEDMFSAYLYASNGELLLASESYAQISGAKLAMDNIKKNANANNFIIDKDKSGRFYYKLRNAQKSILCVGEAYDTMPSCISAIESVKKFCLSAVLVEDTAEAAATSTSNN